MKNKNAGMSVVSSIFLLLVMALMAVSTSEVLNVDSQSGANEIYVSHAFYANTAASEYALFKLNEGSSPDIKSMTFGEASFAIKSDPAKGEIEVTGMAAHAKKIQKFNALFSDDCVDFDMSAIRWAGASLFDAEFQKTCHKRLILTGVSLAWNASVCAQLLPCLSDPGETPQVICHAGTDSQDTLQVLQSELADHLAHGDTAGACNAGDDVPPYVCAIDETLVASCQEFTGGVTIRELKIDGDWLFHNQSYGPGELIELEDLVFEDNSRHAIDQINLENNLPTSTWFAISLHFKDGSVRRLSFKFFE